MSEDHSPDDRTLSRRELLRKGAVVTTVAGLGLSGLAGSAAAIKKEDAIPIDGPTLITEPGYYVLTQDITEGPPRRDSVIRVEAGVNDVVIDGQGYTLDGRGSLREGISAGEYLAGPFTERTTIKNICIRGFTQAGVEFGELEDGLVQNVTITDCESGIRWLTVLDTVVKDCTLKQNTWGLFTTEGNFRNSFVRNRFIENGRAAILEENTDDFLFKNNRIEHNDGGFIISDIGGKSVVVENYFYRNEFGAAISGRIRQDEGDEVTIRRNQFVENENEGAEISEASDYTIEKNEFVRNGTLGIWLRLDTTGVKLSKNLVRGNGDDGVRLTDCSNNEIVKNKILNNGGDGIELQTFATSRPDLNLEPGRGSDDNVIRKNVIKGNAGLPIRIDEFSTGNIIEKNKTDEKSDGGNDGDSDGNKSDDKDSDDDICRINSD